MRKGSAAGRGRPGFGREGRRGWPAAAAVVTSLVAPLTTVRRTGGASIVSAWGVHLAGLAWVVFAVAFVAELAVGHGVWPAAMAAAVGLGGELAELLSERRGWWQLAGMFVAAELPRLMGSGMLAAWGAGDEPAGAAQMRALKRLCLVTPHLATIIVLAAAPILWVAGASDRYWEGVYAAYPPPQYSGPAVYGSGGAGPATNPDWEAYQSELASWQAARTEADASAPWVVRHGDAVQMWVVVAALFWGVWVLLRVVGDGPVRARCVWPPACEACGYSLAGSVREASCPECGLAVAESIGPGSRLGAAWERRAEVGRVRAWVATAVTAACRPRELARQLRLFAGATDHRRFLAASLAMMGGWTLLAGWGWGVLTGDRAGAPYAWVSTAVLIVLGGLGLTLVMATGSGTPVRRADKRNLMPGTMQAASYLSGLLVAWVVVVSLQSAFVDSTSGLWWAGLWRLADWVGTEPELLVAATFVASNGGFAIAYAVLMGRVARALVHVNR